MSLSDSVGAEGGFVCLVDGDGEYSLQESKMAQLMSHVDPTGNGDFSCISIIGCQSTGKSTLLNRIFDTRFAMMDSGKGRSQTTKGLWLDAARNTKSVLIIDVEGTDSGERSTNQTKEKENFERQSILYALALSEIMIVNMWETDIGRWNGSNFGIMKTVFEVNMQLFKSKTKTQILFIIRDYNEDGTPFSSLRQRLLAELNGIWDTLQKPEEYASVEMKEFFDIRFTFLPHFVYCREKFEEAAAKLRDKFRTNEPDGYFDTDYHCEKSKSIPSSDFAQYSQNIWDAIRTNQDLNLPTQREMLATYRCDEIVLNILLDWDTHVRTWLTALQSAPIAHDSDNASKLSFQSDLAQQLKLHVERYDKESEKYIKVIVERKRGELIGKFFESIVELITLHVNSSIFPTLARSFEEEIKQGLSTDEVTFGIMEKCQQLTATQITTFHKELTAIIQPFIIDHIPDQGSIARMKSKFEEDFSARLFSITDGVRKEQLQALISTVLGEFDARVDSKTTELFLGGKQDLWQQLGFLFNTSIEICFDTTKSELASLTESESERILTKKRVLESAQLIIFEKVQRFVEQMPLKLRDRFESLFVYSKGQLRVWKSSDDPRSVYENARDACLIMLRTFRTFNLQRHISPEYVQLLTEPVNPLTPSALPHAFFGASNIQSQHSSSLPQTDENGTQNNSETTVSTTPAPLARSTSVQQNIGATFDPILITREDMYRIETDFERKIQGHLQSAIVEVERIRNQTGLPSWVWAVFLFLGYDEILWALSNPFVLFFLMLVGIGIFVLHQLHLLDPALTLAKAVGTRVFNEVTKAIDGGAAAPQQQQGQQPQQQSQSFSNNANSEAMPNLSRQSTGQLNLDTIDTGSQRGGNPTTTIPTPNTVDSQSVAPSITPTNNGGSEVLSQNSLTRRRPGGYNTMTLNKKNMQQMMQQAMAEGHKPQ